MIRFFARLSIGFIIIFCLVVGMTRLIGALIPMPGLETLKQFDCTPQPCWHGIHIGVTTVQEAASLLSSDKTIRFVDFHPTDNDVCWVWQNQWHI